MTDFGVSFYPLYGNCADGSVIRRKGDVTLIKSSATQMKESDQER